MGCDVALVALLIFCPDFNPRTPCEVRRRDPYPENRGGGISIHAPHTGRDSVTYQKTPAQGYFNPRAPCGARRPGSGSPVWEGPISIHAPLAGRDHVGRNCRHRGRISIHAPLAGRDCGLFWRLAPLLNFNPRTPCRVRPGLRKLCAIDCNISIHAPLAGCDASCLMLPSVFLYFNPRTPCGVRLTM